MNITLGHYLTLGAVLFSLSVIGIFLNRKNLIVLLMAIELIEICDRIPNSSYFNCSSNFH